MAGTAGGPAPYPPPHPARPRRPRIAHARVWEVAIGAATAVVVLLLVLVGSGLLVRSSASAASVTVTEVQWVIQQGTGPTGHGWFGPSYVNVTANDGLPVTVASGGHLTVSLILSDLDVKNHTIARAVATAPFTVTGTTPSLPALVSSGEDDWDLAVTVTVPTVSSSTNATLIITLATTS